MATRKNNRSKASKTTTSKKVTEKNIVKPFAGLESLEARALLSAATPNDQQNTGAIVTAAVAGRTASAFSSIDLTRTTGSATQSYGTGLTYTSTVTNTTGGTPSGTVSLFNGLTQIASSSTWTAGSAPHSGFVTFDLSGTLAPGSYSLVAVFPTFHLSSSVSQTINQVAPATTTLVRTTGAASQSFGTALTFTSAVTAFGAGATPTGTVNLVNTATSTTVASATLSGGIATFVLSSTLGAGAYSLQAQYQGDSNYLTKNSTGTIAQTITTAATTTAVTQSAATTIFGGAVTFTATVTSSGGTPTTNTVTFSIDGSAQTPSSMTGTTATFVTSALTVAGSPHTITAVYNGTGNFANSAAGTLSGGHTVTAASSTTTVTSSPTSSTFGTTVTFTATVTSSVAGTQAGTVQFKVDGTNVGSPVTIAGGVATFTTSSLSAGSHSINGAFTSTNSNFAASSGSTTVTVVQSSSTTTVTSAPASPTFGASVTLTATVTSGVAGTQAGTVQFKVDGSNVGSAVTIASGIATFTASGLAAGSHSIDALFTSTNGNFVNSAGVGSTTLAKASSTTTVTSSSASPNVGDAVTFTATVTSSAAGTQAGTVQFSVDGSTVGSVVTIAGGVATFTTSSLSAGSHSIDGVFTSTNGNFTGSAGNTSVTVIHSPTTTTVTVTPASPTYGGSVTLTATVTASLAGTQAGTVQFKVDGSNVGSPVTIVSGVATFTAGSLSAGAHSIDALFTSTNATFANSAGTASTTLAQASTTTTVSSTPASPTYGDSITITAAVSSGVAGLSGGTVQFSVDGSTVGSAVTVVGGVATFTVSLLNAAPFHTFTAAYSSANANFAGSSGSQINVNVATASTTTTVTSSPASPTYGDSVTLTATITSGVAGGGTGTVQFSIDGGTVGSAVTVSGGVATLVTSGLVAGSHSIDAAFTSTDSNFANSAGIGSTTVATAASTTVFSSSPASPTYGDDVTLIATVSSGVAGTLTGFIQFTQGPLHFNFGGPTAIVGGVATLVLNLTPAGSYQFGAKFTDSDGNYSNSSDFSGAVTVVAAATTTTVAVTPASPTYGGSVTLTASVASSVAGTLAGAVQFKVDGSNVGSPVTIVSGIATFAASGLSAGSHSIDAVFTSSDSNFANSAGVGSTTLAQASSTTTVTSSPASPTYGDNITITATISSAVAGLSGGTVQFSVDGSTVGSAVTVVGGVATYTVSLLNAAPFHTFTAAYSSADANYAGSSGSQINVNVAKALTTTNVSSTPASPTYGDSVTLTATISSTAAGITGGTVQFSIDGGTVGSAITISGGVATYVASGLVAGSHSIDAAFTSTDSNFANSAANGSVSLTKASTTTAVTSTPASPTYGDSVTLTATISSAVAGLAGGTVQFSIDGSPVGSAITISGGVATYVASGLTAGSHSIGAAFTSTDSNFTGSSNTGSVALAKASSTTAITSTPASPSFGDSVTLTATITSAVAGITGGTVQFSVDGSTVGSPIAVSGGVATFTVSGLAAGSHSLDAAFTSTDSNFTGSSTNGSVVVAKAATSTAVTSSSGGNSTYGNAVTFTATVTGGTTGTVQFTIDGSAAGSAVTIVGGIATYAVVGGTLVQGTHTVTAAFTSTDSNYANSDDTGSPFVESVARANTTTTLSITNSQSYQFGTTTTITANVTSTGGSSMTGFVDFYLDGGVTAYATVAISAGSASFTRTTLALGTHTFTATYRQDQNYNTSSSAPSFVTIATDDTATTVTVPGTANYGDTVTTTISVTENVGLHTPTGTVTLFDGASNLGTFTLVSGSYSYVRSSWGVGSHSLTATYTATGKFSSSTTTAPVTLVVSKATSTTTVTGPTSSTYGDSITYTATVSGPAAASGKTGSMSFYDGATLLGSGNVVNGVATFTKNNLKGGTHTILATYSGNSLYNGSSDATGVTLTVATAATTTTLGPATGTVTFGDSFTLTAHVTASNAVGTITGSIVTFFDGVTVLGTVAIDASGNASLSRVFHVGSHTFTASFGGNINYAVSTSGATNLTVNQATSTTAVTVSPAASSTYGNLVTLTASVTSSTSGTSGAITGVVTFFDAGVSIGPVVVSGSTATLTVQSFKAGAHTFTASYAGNTAYAASGLSTPVSYTVNKAAATATLSVTPAASEPHGTAVTLSVHVAPMGGFGTISGTVSLFDNGSGTAMTVIVLDASGNGTYVRSSFPVGSHIITGSYSGNTNFNGLATTDISPITLTIT